MKRCVLISGDRCSGKTETCRKLFLLMRDMGMDPYGIIEESERDGSGIPLSLRFRELTTGKEVLLGRRAARGDGGSYPPFIFRRNAIAWANSAIDSRMASAGGPILLDEIGPLELTRKRGLLPAVNRMAGDAKRHIIMTVRTDLLSLMEAMLAERLDGGFRLSAFSLGGRQDREAAGAAVRSIISMFENDMRAVDTGHGPAFCPERI